MSISSLTCKPTDFSSRKESLQHFQSTRNRKKINTGVLAWNLYPPQEGMPASRRGTTISSFAPVDLEGDGVKSEMSYLPRIILCPTMCPRVESNHDFLLRREMSYPLYDEDFSVHSCALGRNPSPTESFWRGTCDPLPLDRNQNPISLLVSLAGIEPATLWTATRCSIH